MPKSKSGKVKLVSRKGPCKTGSSRNPATNRCKKNVKACPTGSSRNPVSNRCKKDVLPKIQVNLGTIRGDKIYNDATNRWVNLDSKLGRKIQDENAYQDGPDEYPREYYY
jgi:hypothetical protein